MQGGTEGLVPGVRKSNDVTSWNRGQAGGAATGANEHETPPGGGRSTVSPGRQTVTPRAGFAHALYIMQYSPT